MRTFLVGVGLISVIVIALGIPGLVRLFMRPNIENVKKQILSDINSQSESLTLLTTGGSRESVVVFEMSSQWIQKDLNCFCEMNAKDVASCLRKVRPCFAAMGIEFSCNNVKRGLYKTALSYSVYLIELSIGTYVIYILEEHEVKLLSPINSAICESRGLSPIEFFAEFWRGLGPDLLCSNRLEVL